MANMKSLKALVDKKVEMLQKKVEKLYGKRVPNVKIKYDLKSIRTAGMAVTNPWTQRFDMRLHEAALNEYQEDYIEGTVVHEFAHLVQHCFYNKGGNRPKPHGKEWKRVMRELGKNPERCHSMNLSQAMEKFAKVSGKPAPKKRQLKRFTYKCNCDTHELTSIRHNKIKNGQASYTCRSCGSKLVKA